MATTGLVSTPFGDSLLECGTGTPDHTSPVASIYTDIAGKIAYMNLDGATSWGKLSESDAGLTIFGTETSVAVIAYGTDDLPMIPIGPKMAGTVIKNVYAYHDTIGSGAGTTDIGLKRVRSGTAVDVLSTKITTDGQYFANDGVINTSNDDLIVGDMLVGYVSAIEGTAPKGLFVLVNSR